MRLLLRFIIVMMALPAATDISAQSNFKGYSAGVSLGTLIYQGDLTPKYYGYTKQLKPAISIHVSKSFGLISLRMSLVYGKILADESKYTQPEFRQFRNFKFSSKVMEFSGQVVLRPFGHHVGEVSPYFFAGGGITYLHVKRDWSRFKSEYFDKQGIAALSLMEDSVHSLPHFIPVLPLGAGISYAITPSLSLDTELTFRLTRHDYMDGFRYQDTDKRDRYYGLSMGLTWRFVKDQYACPTL